MVIHGTHPAQTLDLPLNHRLLQAGAELVERLNQESKLTSGVLELRQCLCSPTPKYWICPCLGGTLHRLRFLRPGEDTRGMPKLKPGAQVYPSGCDSGYAPPQETLDHPYLRGTLHMIRGPSKVSCTSSRSLKGAEAS